MVCQKYIYKLHSSRLRKARWKLTLPLAEARKNDEVIALADSQILRWIDKLNGLEDSDARAKEIKREIKRLRNEENSAQNKRRIKALYAQLDEVQFKPDYLCVIMDKEKDYRRACNGFKINDIEYVRLLGTNGGVKTSTIVFVSKRLAPELRRLIDNGRDKDKPLVPAKLEAYRALVCSGSTPVSMPKGVAIIGSCLTHFKSDMLTLTDESDGDPVMSFVEDGEVELNATDGCGMMLPSLAERWSEELHLDYTTCGVNTRFSWEKGMVFTFDFLAFADEVAGARIIKDAWGDEVDLSNVELILTTDMVKLWDSYASCEDYLKNSTENGYTFGVTKACPKKLERERGLNYQFIQSYDLSDEDIDELIKPTMSEFQDVLHNDWAKTILFLKGCGLNDKNVEHLEDDYSKALMIEPSLLDDPYIQSSIYRLIKNKINEAKVGVLKVHGNYSIISGDLYALCQSMFGLEVTGLLRAGEIYNKFWLEEGSDNLVCFRAPMTSHNNIRMVRVANREEVLKWYQYINTGTILNAFDLASQALNGCDFDGDMVMLTDNDVLVRNLVELPAVMCAQRRAKKCVPGEEELIQSNIDSFGDEIGKITNRVTSMFDVQAQFPKDSSEYKELDYRIKCGQLFQQNF